MTRLELLKILVGQARDNGFEFRRWFTTRLELPWTDADAAFTALEAERRYYALLFSHDFARSFWKTGAPITMQVAAQTFSRRMADGSIGEVTRKPFMRRSARTDVWRYHLREMAVAPEPLRYIRRFLSVEEDLDGVSRAAAAPASAALPATSTLALARKAHARRLQEMELEKKLAAVPEKSSAPTRRSARLPGQPNKRK